MPFTKIAPGSGGEPDFVSTSTVGPLAQIYFEVLRNDVFVASTYPPTAGVGQNGWSGTVAGSPTPSDNARVNVPANVVYQPSDVFQYRTYLTNGKRDVYRFQVDGTGTGDDTAPDCITLSDTVGIVALQGAQMPRVTPPPFGSLCYQVTKNSVVYSCYFDGTWHLTSPGPTPENPGGEDGSGEGST